MFIGHKLRRAAQKGGIEFVGRKMGATQGGGVTLNLTTLSDGIDTEAREDDIVVLVQSHNGVITNYDMTVTTSGYTEEADLYSADEGISHNLGAHYKVMGATPDTEVVTPTYNTGGANVAIALVFRGVDTVTPIDVTTTTAIGNNTADVDPPAITPITNGAAIVALGGSRHDHGGAVTYSEPAGYEYFIDNSRNDGVYDASALAAFLYWDGVGAFNPAISELSLDSLENSWSAATLALRPA